MMNRHLRRAIIASIASAGLITPAKAELWVPPKPGIIRADEYKTLPVIPSLITMGMLAKAAAAAAGVSFVSATSANATSVALTTHQAGDIIVIYTTANASNTPPTLAAGYTSINNGNNGTAIANRLAYKIAASSSETSGTWTGASSIYVGIWRGVSAIGGQSNVGSNSNTLSYGTITLQVTTGSSWVAMFGSAISAGSATPAGASVRVASRVFDTGAGVTSFATRTAATTPLTTTDWRTACLELKA